MAVGLEIVGDAGDSYTDTTSLRVVILEDDDDDATLVKRELIRSGYDLEAVVVADRDSFVQAIHTFAPEIVLADCQLPNFSGAEALQICLDQTPDLPVIIVSGAFSDEKAVELIRMGAADYILKDRRARLPNAVRRALALVAEQAQLRAAEADRDRAYASLEIHAAELALANGGLAHTNEELQQLTYAAAHDLSEPLGQIAGPIGLLAHRYEGQIDDEADELIRFAVDGCVRLRSMIDGLLSYSSVDLSEEVARSIDCTTVVNAIVSSLGPGLTQSTVHVDPLPVVRGTRSQLSSVFENLISNAVKFMSPGMRAEIAVAVVETDREWRFTVSDNGIGIAPRHRERVFGIFKRLNAPEAYPGTGIGLALSKKIVERHGGRIGVEDNPTGRGSLFWFTLPKGDEVAC